MTESNNNNNLFYMRLLNASPDSPALDIYINNKPYASNFKYKSFTQYFSGQSGTYNLKIYLAGDKNTLLINKNLDFYTNNIYTIALIGLYELNTLNINLIPDHLRTINKNFTYIRFINLSPTSNQINIKLDNNLIISDLSYTLPTDYFELRPKSYDLKIYLSNTNLNSNQEILILQNPKMLLSANKIYSGYIIGTYNQNLNTMQILLPLEGATYLKF